MHVPTRLLALVLAHCALAGCTRYEAVLVPEIRGMLLDENHAPVANADVAIAQHSDFDNPCKEATLQGSTNALGEFVIAKRTEISWEFLNDPEDVGQITHLCFRPPGGETFFGGMIVHAPARSQSLLVTCDASESYRSPLGRSQMCALVGDSRRGEAPHVSQRRF